MGFQRCLRRITVTNDGDLTAIAPGIGEIRAQVDTFEVRASHVTVKSPLAQQLTFFPTWNKQAIPQGRIVLLNARFSGEDRATFGWKEERGPTARNGGQAGLQLERHGSRYR